MLSIQDAGKQILLGNPGKFYIFAGSEYGIKDRYLSMLKSHYGEYVEFTTVQELFQLMRSKHIIPLKPKLYIIRYDEDYIQSLSDKSNSYLNNLKISGTCVCVYESEKHVSKCAKYLPDYTVSFDNINSMFIRKYLASDYPTIESALLDFSVNVSKDYRGASNICNCISFLSKDTISRCNNDMFVKTFVVSQSADDKAFKHSFAARSVAGAIDTLDAYDTDISTLLYSMLSALLELEKLLCNARTQSELQNYVKYWTIEDVYQMVLYVYSELEKSRTINSYDAYNSIIYLLSLLAFSPIPSLEVLK